MNCVTYFKPALKLSNHGRASGGIIVIVKNHINEILNIECIDHDFDNVVCLKMNYDIANYFNDVFLIVPYLPPASSPFYNVTNYNHGFELLDDFFSYIYSKFTNLSIILCGDLNSRIGNIQPITDCDYNSRFLDCVYDDILFCNDYEYEKYNRFSEDTKTNTYGKYLYELCNNYSLYILNGINNCNESGRFTFISPNGNSLVDYFLISSNLTSNEVKMHVLNDIISWHMPITLSIVFNYSNFEIDDKPIVKEKSSKLIWDNDKATVFIESFNALQHMLPVINDENNILNIDHFVSKLTEIMLSASECMNKPIYENKKQFIAKNKWFDTECSIKRKLVKNLLHKYTRCKSDVNKTNYVNNRNEYKSLLTRKKYLFSIFKIDSLKTCMNLNSNTFWKQIKTLLPTKQKVVNCINITDWFTFFSNMFNSNISEPKICTEQKVVYCFDQNELDTLCMPITQNECLSAMSSIKFNRAPGCDGVLNEMIFHAREPLSPILCSVFNTLFSNRIFIDVWQKAIISPIFKKGNINTCSNYRPISLTSLLSKLYTHILNTRLTKYTVNLDIIPIEQAAFRANFSTVDHIFTLYTLICKQFNQNRKLYVAFIDYRRCFDNINRQALFTVLERYGIVGHFLDVIKSIYSNVLSAVKNNTGTLTEPFECPNGLKQGCILSPLLFNIFISEVSKSINTNGIHGLQLVPNSDIFHHLFYADDNCIFSTTPVGLQNKLNILYDLSVKLGMEVNLDKTKIIVFRKGGHLSRFEKWHYNHIPIEVVNTYNYLGITFSTRMSFTNMCLPLIAKAKRSINEILFSLRTLSHFDLSIFLKLFDSKIFPILSYGCELWGLHNLIEIERVHLYALKRFLNVSLHTSNNKVYSETGRYPLNIAHTIRCVKYWFKIKQHTQTRLTKQSYDCLSNMCLKGHQNWVSMIKHTLFSNGYGIVWIMGEVGNKELFFRKFKQTLIDNFIQGWNAKMSDDVNCTFYYSFKSIIETEMYLKNHHIKLTLRNVLVKFRLGVSQINAHRYKFSKDDNLKLCSFCIRHHYEDEYHILFTCPLYENLRNEYLTKIMSFTNGSVIERYQFSSFMQSNQYVLAKYLFNIFLQRQYIMKSRS